MLGQLGNRVQHALRAFTPDDAKALRATVRTFPKSDFYDLEELLTQLGTGEAAVTILCESGVPTPVVHTRMRPPLARMGPADDVDGRRDREPALSRSTGPGSTARARASCWRRGSTRPRARPGAADQADASARRRRRTPSGGGADAIGDFLKSSSGRAIKREVVRGLFGLLKQRRLDCSRWFSHVPRRTRRSSLAGAVRRVVRGVALWRQGKRTSGAFSDELALFEERSARTEQLLARGRSRERRISRRRPSGCASPARSCRCCWARSRRRSAARAGCAPSCRSAMTPRRSGRPRDELDPAPRRGRRRRAARGGRRAG